MWYLQMLIRRSVRIALLAIISGSILSASPPRESAVTSLEPLQNVINPTSLPIDALPYCPTSIYQAANNLTATPVAVVNAPAVCKLHTTFYPPRGGSPSLVNAPP